MYILDFTDAKIEYNNIAQLKLITKMNVSDIVHIIETEIPYPVFLQ